MRKKRKYVGGFWTGGEASEAEKKKNTLFILLTNVCEPYTLSPVQRKGGVNYELCAEYGYDDVPNRLGLDRVPVRGS